MFGNIRWQAAGGQELSVEALVEHDMSRSPKEAIQPASHAASCTTMARERALVFAMLFGLPSSESPSKRMEWTWLPS